MRRFLHNYVPSTFRNPVRLASRLISTGDPAALFAMAATAGGLAAAPFDIAMTPWERRRYATATAHTGPLLLICGAPRSGTTIVYQTLVRALPATPFTNVVHVFPRSPLTASRLLRRWTARRPDTFENFYGRTFGLGGLNDALPLWDRFLGPDRDAASTAIAPAVRDQMRRFFAAWSSAFSRPVISKCNRLVTGADQVAEALPEAVFICLDRSPLAHACSLWEARRMIHGDVHRPYGTAGHDERVGDDPVASVCEQVRFFADLVRRQEAAIGTQRFWVQSYEDFCMAPDDLVSRAARHLFPEGMAEPIPTTPPHQIRTGAPLDGEVLVRLKARLAAIGLLGEGDKERRFDPAETSGVHEPRRCAVN